MTSDNEPNHHTHKKLTDQIADGEAIDWQKYNTETEALKKIKTIEQVAKAFTQSITSSPKETTKDSHSFLFKWGHLNVINKIGEGSFGLVYKAFDTILNRNVALKLRHTEIQSAIGSRAFLEEARRLASVRHPNVIAVHGAAIEANQVGIWTDLINGQNLKEYFRIKGQLELHTAYDLINDMAQALQAVHEANLIHGDVKASNVMRQENGVFKLMDFGAGSESMQADLTPHAGSPLFMAPELFDDKSISTACDQYSLGVMLYQLLSGQYPITATSVNEIKNKHLDPIITPLHKLRPNLPKKLADLIHELLAKKPDERPTATEVWGRINWIKSAPQRRKKTWAVATIISSLCMGILVSSLGYINAVRSEEKAVLSKQESVAVSNFLAEIIKSARPGESGKNTPILEILEQAEIRLKTSLLDQPLAKAEVLHHMGKSFQRISMFDAAHKSLNQAYNIRQQFLGKHHVETLTTQGELGATLNFLTRFDEAKELLMINDEIINKLPLKDNKRIQFWVNQSLYFKANGKSKEALSILEQSLELIDKQRHPDYFYDLLLQYGNSLLNQQQFISAEKVINQVYGWAKKDTSRKALLLKTRSALVRLYGQTERYEQAEKYVRQNIQIKSEWLGVDDESVIWSNTLLSKVLNAQGKIEESAKINEHALNLSMNKFGENYWLTLNLMSDKASLLNSLNLKVDAIRQYRKTIAIADKTFPNRNYSVLPMKNLTTLYYETGQFILATEMAQKTIPYLRERHGDDHRSIHELQLYYGASLFHQGQESKAVQILSSAMSKAEKNLIEDQSLIKEIKAMLKDDSSAQ